jgi:hypothetical protein
LDENGWTIGVEIDATADVSGSYQKPEPDVGFPGGFEDIELTDVEIQVTRSVGSTAWEVKMIKLPDDLKPYIDRWVAANEAWLSDKLADEL